MKRLAIAAAIAVSACAGTPGRDCVLEHELWHCRWYEHPNFTYSYAGCTAPPSPFWVKVFPDLTLEAPPAVVYGDPSAWCSETPGAIACALRDLGRGRCTVIRRL